MPSPHFFEKSESFFKLLTFFGLEEEALLCAEPSEGAAAVSPHLNALDFPRSEEVVEHLLTVGKVQHTPPPEHRDLMGSRLKGFSAQLAAPLRERREVEIISEVIGDIARELVHFPVHLLSSFSPSLRGVSG